MREIIFRGKRTNNDEWVEGNLMYSEHEDIYYIGVTELMYTVIPETVGQFTGLLDRNGKKIFEGDIVVGQNYMFPCYDSRRLTVKFSIKEQAYITRLMNKDEIEIIGNIHETNEDK